MFERYPDARLKPEPTPERVMAMLRTLAEGPVTRLQLTQMMTLSADSPPSAYSILFDAVRELGFVKEMDGVVTLCLEPAKFADFSSLRREISGIVFNRPESSFYLVSQRVLALNDELLVADNWDQLANLISDEQFSFNEDNVLGWRWWASFLGLGYIHATTFMPNLALRIKDSLYTAGNFPRETELPAEVFVNKLEGLCPESRASRRERSLGLGVSNGLRLLAKQGLLEIKNERDAERWSLHHIEVHPLNAFTHVVVRGDDHGLA